MTLLNHQPAEGLTVVPLIDMPPSHVVAAWNEGHPNPLILRALMVRPDGLNRFIRTGDDCVGPAATTEFPRGFRASPAPAGRRRRDRK